MEDFVRRYMLGKEAQSVVKKAKRALSFSCLSSSLYVFLGSRSLKNGCSGLAHAIIQNRVHGLIVSREMLEEEMFRVYLGPFAVSRTNQSEIEYILGEYMAFPRHLVEPLLLMFLLAPGERLLEKWSNLKVPMQYSAEESWLIAAFEKEIPFYLPEEMYLIPNHSGIIYLDNHISMNSWEYEEIIERDSLDILCTLFFCTLIELIT